MARLTASLAAAQRAVAAHPDLAAVTLIVVLGAALRIAFFPRAPVFLHGDSIQYHQPAYALMHGEGFPLTLKRPPVYPIFLALVGQSFGEAFNNVIAMQHLFGIGTAVLAYGTGRLIFGRAVGLLSGLATALSGGLVIYEHYLLTEALFTLLLALVAFLFVLGVRRASGWCFVGTGLTIGLATLTRPHAQLLLVLAPFVLAACYRPWRRSLQAAALIGVAAAIVMLPWMVRNRAVHGSFTVAGALGQNLVAKTAVFHNGAFVFYDEDNPPDHLDPKRRQARKIIQDRADDKAEDPTLEVWGISIHRRIMRQLRVSEAEADAYMRDAAIAAILDRPGTYARIVLDDFWQIFVGAPEELRRHWEWDTRYWRPEARHLVRDATPEQNAGIPMTERLIELYQSPRLGWLLPVLFVVGLAASSVVPPWRPGVFLGLTVIALHLASAATVAFVPRYHYPPFPLMHVVTFGGGLVLIRLGAASIDRLRRRSDGRLTHAEPATRSTA